MIKRIIFTIGLIFFFKPAFAQQIQGQFANWGIFSADFGKKKICYMLSLPVKQEGNYIKRADPYFLVVNSADNIDEITISSGYLFKEGSEVEMSFGLKKFNVFTYKNLAWAKSKTDDIDILKELRNSLDVVVIGIDKNNRYSLDTYSLIGFKQAFFKMKEICKY